MRNIKGTIKMDIHVSSSISGVLSFMNFRKIKDLDKSKLLNTIQNAQYFYLTVQRCTLKYIPSLCSTNTLQRKNRKTKK